MEETRIFPRPTPRGPPNALLHESILTLRFIQQSCLTTALFIAAYFAYWHVLLVDPVPSGLYVLVGSGSFVLLFSHFGTLSHALYPETAGILPLKGTLYQALLFSMGLFGLVSVEYIGSGQTDDWFKPIRESNGYSSLKPAGVEEHHAILGRCLLGLTGGGWLITIIMSGIAIWRAAKSGDLKFRLPRQARSRGNYVAVGSEAYEFDEEETMCDEESVKSN